MFDLGRYRLIEGDGAISRRGKSSIGVRWWREGLDIDRWYDRLWHRWYLDGSW